jgi:O-antigen ligase
VAVACALSIELTLTRSVWVASSVGLLVALLAARQTRRYLLPVALGSVVLVVGALAVVPGLQDDANDRVSDNKPIWDRENANGAAVRMIESDPLVGHGWGTFAEENGRYQRLSDDHRLTRANLDEHNVFLSHAVELGLPAALLWAAALLLAVGGACLSRRGPPDLFAWRIGLLAIATQWLIVANFVPLGFAFPNALLWLWAGVAFGPQEERVPVANEVRPEAGPPPLPA